MLLLFRVLIVGSVVCLLAEVQVQAQKASCTNWNLWLLNPADPRNPLEQADGVNDNRTVVGLSYPLSSKLMPPYWGLVHYFSGKVTYWHPANAKKSWFTGRNDVGNTVGNYIDTLGVQHAAYLHGSTTTLIVHPKAVHHSTYLIDINNLNTILVVYSGSDGVNHLFKRRSNGTFLSVPNFPGAQVTYAGAFNDNGVVVGGYILPGDPGDIQRGFIYRNGSFAPVNYRNTFTHTDLVGIDNNGVIVGNWYANGFLYKNGVFKDIVGPHGEYVTARGISANGIITGDIWSKSMATHGFTAVCQ